MKAFQISKHAHPSKVPVSNDAPMPVPTKGEVLVDVYAAGMNFLDILQAQGLYQTKPPLPFNLGAEFAGIINANSPIPKGCPFKPGDRVFGWGQGTYAEHVAINVGMVIPMPDNLSFEQAATVPLSFTTSYLGLVHQGRAKAGEWVLVHAGAGGVGLAACQIAKMLGCKVIATASSDEKRRICKEKGRADEAVDYTKEGWQKEVVRITGGKGVDVVYDPVGMIVPSLRCVAISARLLVVGFAGGTIEKIPANLLLLKQVFVIAVLWGATAIQDPQHAKGIVADILNHLASGTLVPVIYEPIYDGLENVSRGLVDLDNRKVWGKAVVRVRQGEGEGVRARL